MKIYLIRHGHYFEFNDDDGNLTEKGEMQARRLGERFISEGVLFNKIYCSSKVRAFETAKIVSGILGIEEIIKSNELIEDRNDESEEEVVFRMRRLINEAKSELKDGCVGMFSHYYAIKYLTRSLGSPGIQLPHLGVVLLDYTNEEPRIVDYNPSAHLIGIESL